MMSPADYYPWIKALHVASALIFVGGLVGTSLFIRSVVFASESASAMAVIVRRWDRAVTLPAMGLVWAFGIGLVMSGGWAGGAWLPVKAGVVLALSALHGIQAGQLRRIVNRTQKRAWRTGPWLIAGMVAVAMLAVAKPF
jgi:putative membrane protein